MTSVAIDLAGEWIGYYSGHFDEVIWLTKDGDHVEAGKITGDDFVPAGELTWQADLRTGEAQGQFAEREFRHARSVPGKLVVLSPERIVFCWTGYGQGEYDA